MLYFTGKTVTRPLRSGGRGERKSERTPLLQDGPSINQHSGAIHQSGPSLVVNNVDADVHASLASSGLRRTDILASTETIGSYGESTDPSQGRSFTASMTNYAEFEESSKSVENCDQMKNVEHIKNQVISTGSINEHETMPKQVLIDQQKGVEEVEQGDQLEVVGAHVSAAEHEDQLEKVGAHVLPAEHEDQLEKVGAHVSPAEHEEVGAGLEDNTTKSNVHSVQHAIC